MSYSPYKIENGIFFLHEETPEEIARGELLMRLDKRENHLYDDAEVREFPTTFSYNLHKEAWKEKSDLFDRFIKYLNKRFPEAPQPHVVLHLCSGMGWLPAKLAERKDFQVIGLENRKWLLEQATRVFYRTNVKFLYGDILKKPFGPHAFDLIIIDEAMQYFPDLSQLLDSCFACLKSEGEIHLLNNPFYPANRIESQQNEQLIRLRQINCEATDPHLFVHSIESLRAYNITLMAKKSGLAQLFGAKKNNYTWVRIVR